ncbi:MAG: hypothetical protein ACTIKT_06050 [Microbacterium sp.]
MIIANEPLMSPKSPRAQGGNTPAPRDSRGYLIGTGSLLLAGGFLAGLGWVLGLFMLWHSKSHSVTSKIICTFVWPGGLAAALVSLFIPVGTTPGYFVDTSVVPVAPATSGWTIAYIIAIFVIPIVTQCVALRIALQKGGSTS